MNQGAVAIVIAAISLAGTGLAAWLSARAQRAGAKVQEKAALFEGYDEFTAHLRARVAELTDELDAAGARLREATVECRECQELLRHAREDYEALRMVLELLRRELGLPTSWDPWDHLEQATGIRPYGRRATDAPVPPPGWPGREHWIGAPPGDADDEEAEET